MAQTRGRPPAGDGRQIRYRTIPMSNERSAALGRASAMLGVSRATLIIRLVDAGLSVLLPTKEKSLCRTHPLNTSPLDTATRTPMFPIALGLQAVCGRITRAIVNAAGTLSARAGHALIRIGIILADLS